MNSPHQLHETRSLRMHRLVEERYRATPVEVIRFGLDNLKRWEQRGVECEDFKIWEEILRMVPQCLPEILCGSSEEAIRLRQSSPFAGLVPEASRQQILSTSQ